jgi:integrase
LKALERPLHPHSPTACAPLLPSTPTSDRSEILPLQWRQIDFKAGVVTLGVGSTKNRDRRTFPMTPELRAMLEAQRATTDVLQKKIGAIVPWVFHRTKRGRPLKSFTKSWRKACRAPGHPARIPHDFRRTAVRNLERAGVPRSTAMAMVGHRTESVYRRYAIVDEVMFREGAAKPEAYSEGTVGKVLGKVKGRPKSPPRNYAIDWRARRDLNPRPLD